MENFPMICWVVFAGILLRALGASTENYWWSIASDSTGQHLAAVSQGGHIYVSNDFGTTFTATATVQDWWSITSDSSGQYLAAVDRQNVYLSNNFGRTWSKTGNLLQWQAIACDSSGNRLAAVTLGQGIYVSSNRGNSWNSIGILANFTAIASDSTGQHLVAVIYNGYIYVSNDFGNSWTQTGSYQIWLSVTSDSSGRYWAAVAYNNYIYRSTDYGKSWMQAVGSTGNWYCIASDSSGGRVIVGSIGSVYVFSNNFGAAWTANPASFSAWTAVASDSSGKRLAAGAFLSSIYVSNDYGRTWVQSAMTVAPTVSPTFSPSFSPTIRPTRAPTNPTSQPSSAPSRPTFQPTVYVIPTYCLCLSNAWLSALLVPVLVLFVLSFFLVENKVKVFFIIAIPVLDVLTDLIYVVQKKFVFPLVLSLAIVFLLLPTVGLIYELILVGKMRPSFFIALKDYLIPVAVIWRNGYPYLFGWKFHPFNALNSPIKLVIFWMGVGLIMSLQAFLWMVDVLTIMAISLINGLMIISWFFLGFVAFHVKLFSIEVVWENWKAVWTSEPVSQEEISEVINARLINKAALCHLVLETLPHLILQTYNNQILGWDFISQLSTVLSVLMIIQVGYHYLYHMFWKKMSLDEMPSNPYGISVKERSSRFTWLVNPFARNYSIYRVASDDPNASFTADQLGDFGDIQLSQSLSFDKDQKDQEGELEIQNQTDQEER